jgi:hypothetical protein
MRAWRPFLPPALLVLAGLLVAPVPARAQGSEATALTLERVPGVERAQMAGLETDVKAAGDRYSVQDLDIMQPVAVRLRAIDPSRTVRLEVVKGEWTSVYRDCSTRGATPCEVRFRTQGNFGMRVTSPEGAGARYELGVFVGDEMKLVPANVVVPPRDAGQAAGSGLGLTNILLGVIAVALVGLLLVVGWSVLRKRNQEAS